MLNAALIGFNILLYTFQNLFFKMFADRYPGKSKYVSYVYCVVCGLVSGFVSLAFGGFSFDFNPLTLLFGVLNSITAPLYYLALSLASQNGPYSIVMVFNIAGGISIPVLVSAIAFGEYPSVWKLLCFLVIFVAGYFVTKRPNESAQIKNKKVFFASLVFLGVVNGCYGGLINLQRGFAGESQNDEMLIYTFLISAVFSLIFLFFRNGKEAPRLFVQTKGSAAFMIAAAISAAFAVNMLVIMAGFINVNLLWTFNNSGVLVVSVLASAIFFKEKMSLQNIIGCVVVAAALVVVSMV